MNCHVINPRITINIPLITPVTNHFEVSWHSRLGASSSHVQVSDVNHRGKAQQPIQKGKLRISTEDEANGAKNLEIDGWRMPKMAWPTKMPIACREVTMFYTIFFSNIFSEDFVFGVCTIHEIPSDFGLWHPPLRKNQATSQRIGYKKGTLELQP